MRRCGHDCDCPSKLHHAVQALVARIEAPIPPPSLREVRNELQGALELDEED